MRKAKLVVPIAAAAGLLVTATGVSYADHAAQRTPSLSGGIDVELATQSSATMQFKVYRHPTQKYTTGTCVFDLSRFDDWAGVSSIRGCGTKITLSKEFLKESVPDSWSTWSCPPASETCTPDVLFSDFATAAATIDFGRKVTTGGFEYEPRLWQVETIKVAFFSGRFGSGTLVGSISRQVDGNGGARLFAAKARKGFQSAVITNDADDDFAIAQIRVQ